ncbi:hypothetical protein GA0115239_103742 [Streptomyces sp. BpilaLS-43]|uniref:hypothetical protein n=1 Tax=Streptomyces sp. BpilaLS-43 TaxID=1839778 RepID=UPI00081B58E7|nr:hypothetical protein [Streptomyces sp. BpilaLS-43]SCD57680.1 hypothetical protein GA0115239_103742 [Streptomyces sp. BpilaLS-43]
MSQQQRLTAPLSVFRDDEPMIQSQPLMPGAQSPRFGDMVLMDFNGVVERPANRYPTEWRIPMGDMASELNLLGRELAMIWFNPRHKEVLARGIHLKPTWRSVGTVRSRLVMLRSLAEFGAGLGLQGFTEWSDDDFKSFLARRNEEAKESGRKNVSTEHVTVIRSLHLFRDVLAAGGPGSDPWPGVSARTVIDLPSPAAEVSTPAIAPDTWFALVRASWIYIDRFGANILGALARWQRLREAARKVGVERGELMLRAWLADPANKIPMRFTPSGSEINWDLLTWMLGIDPSDRCCQLFAPSSRPGRARRQLVEEAVVEGRTESGLVAELVQVDRPDGTRGPWHPALQARDLWLERTALRNACLIFTLAMSMMRDSEARAVLKGSVVEYYSTPAVKSTKRKLDPDLPTRHWWIIKPVAKAIDIASQVSVHNELAFASVNEGEPDAIFDSQTAIDSFVKHVNRFRHRTGLAEIPVSKVTAHMFRKTMAMLTRDYPGSEIAVGMQLQHVATRALANRSTGGYMAKDAKWAKHLEDAISERKFERLKELFRADSRGENVGYGPGADRMRETFQAVREKAEELRSTGQAQRGDIRVEFDLLRRTKFSIRFGKLNHCTMDDDNPAGAKCIEDAVVPAGHRGPLHDRCRPSRCSNSFVTIEHIPIWRAEHGSLTRLRSTPKIAPARKASLDAQLRDVEIVLKKVDGA